MADERLDQINERHTKDAAEPRPGLGRRLVRWLRAHHMTIMTLPDTPHNIALGSAIGMFFGFTPLFGLKTILAFVTTWTCRANKTSAVITVQLHDILLPFVPALFFWQYKIGMWAMYSRVPQREGFRRVALSEWMEWTTFLTVGRPILVGSLFFAVPSGLLVYFGLRGVLIRARAKAAAAEAAT